MADKNLIFDIYNEDGTSFNGLSLNKSTYSSVVMSLDDKIEGDIYYKDNTLSFTFKEYILYKGIKYYMKLDVPPTIVKKGITEENSELKGMTKYSLTFYHPMVLLYNIPFTDVAVSDNELKYKSQDTTFYWIGTLTDMVGKINKNLQGTLWTCSLQPDFVDSGTQSDVIQFQDQKISDVLKTSYETWKIPYTIDGYNILFGKPSNEIYIEGTTTPYIFKLGQHLGLKNNDRTPKNNTIITRIAGYGSEDNIPSGYPLIAWTGDQTWNYTINNDSEAINSYGIIDGVINGESVRIINHPFTRKNLMPSNYVDYVNKKVNPLAIGYDKDIELIDYYDAIDDASHTYINHINPLAPSYYKKGFDGADKSVNTIKPTIVGAKYNNQEIDIIKAISWINDDKTPATGIDDTYNTTTGKYTQGYFNIELYPLGFDLYAMAAATEAMSINMTSGACNGCKFELAVDWDIVKTNFYYTDSSGNVIFDPTNIYSNHRDYTKFPDSTNISITVIVKKDTNTFGTIMPNTYQQPKVGDKFVFIGIAMPQIRIDSAQTLLDEAMKQYMKENNFAYYEYPFDFDNYFLETNEYILSQIKTNCIVRFEYGADTLALSVKEYSITWGDKALPTYKITLTDDVTIVMNQIGEVADGLSKLGSQVAQLQTSYNINIIDELSKKVSKIDDDTVKGKITFLKGIISEAISKFNLGAEFGTYVTGLLGTGAKIDGEGNAFVRNLTAWEGIITTLLSFNQVDVIMGQLMISNCRGVIDSIDTDKQIITERFANGDAYSSVHVGDIIRGVYNNIAGEDKWTDNATEDYADDSGFVSKVGYFTAYFTPVEILEYNKGVCRFRYALKEGSHHPCPDMKFASYGSFTTKSRRGCKLITETTEIIYRNVNTWTVTDDGNLAEIHGLMDGHSLTQVDGSILQLEGVGSYCRDNMYLDGVVITVDSIDGLTDIVKNNSGYQINIQSETKQLKVDDQGNVIDGIKKTVNGTMIYNVQASLLVTKGTNYLTLLGFDSDSDTTLDGHYTIELQPHGCTCLLQNGNVIITAVNGLQDGDAQTVNFDYDKMRAINEISVDILINCEGNIVLNKTFRVPVIHTDTPFISSDLSNEMDSFGYNKISLAKVGLPISTTLSLYKGTEKINPDFIILDFGGYVSYNYNSDTHTGSIKDENDNVVLNYTLGYNDGLTGLITITDISPTLASKIVIGINATVTYAGVAYERRSELTINRLDSDVVYNVLPSVNQIIGKYNTSNILVNNPSTVSCSVTARTTEGVSTLSDLTGKCVLKYKIDDGTETTYSGAVDVSLATSGIRFNLYDMTGNLIDTELIPVVNDGDTGTAGRGIDNIVKRYLATSASSGVTSSSGNWSYSMVAPTATNKYLWCWTNTYYTDGTYDITYEIIAVYGDAGSPGATGIAIVDCGRWNQLSVYYYNNSERDYVTYNGTTYIRINQGVSCPAGTLPTNTTYFTQSSYFSVLQVYTFLSQEGKLGNFSYSNNIFRSNTTDQSSYGAILYMNSDTGEFHCANVDITGTITATNGKIGGFYISGNSLINTGFDNDATVIFRNDTYGTFAGIGGNVLPPSSGIRAVARFENYDTTDQWGFSQNIALMVGAKNSSNLNYAIYIEGGMISGFATKTVQVSSNTTLTQQDCYVSCYNSSSITISLPSSPEAGKDIYIYNMNGKGVTVSGNGKSIRVKGSNVSSVTCNNACEEDHFHYDGQYWCYTWGNYA